MWTIFVFVSKSKDDNFCTMEETKKNPETYIQTNSSFVKKYNQITSTKMGIRNCKKRKHLKDIELSNLRCAIKCSKNSGRKCEFNNFLFFWLNFFSYFCNCMKPIFAAAA